MLLSQQWLVYSLLRLHPDQLWIFLNPDAKAKDEEVFL